MKKLLLITLMSLLSISNAWASAGGAGAGAGRRKSMTHQEALDTQLRIAVIEGKLEKVKELLEQNADANAITGKKLKQTPLMGSASRVGGVAITNLLIKHGADVNAQDAQGKTVLMFAIDSRDPDQIKTLLNTGASRNLRNIKGEDALAYAKTLKKSEALCEILESYESKQENKKEQ